MGNNKYIDKFDEISKGLLKSGHKEESARRSKAGTWINWQPKIPKDVFRIIDGDAEVPRDRYEVGRLMSSASYLMKEGVIEGNIEEALEGAKLYEKLGQGGRGSVKNKLIMAYKRSVEEHPAEAAHSQTEVRAFLTRNQGKDRGLESHVAIAVFLIIGAAGVFFLSSNLTGNVIGNLPNTSSVAGAILFLIGVVGLFFTFERNK